MFSAIRYEEPHKRYYDYIYEDGSVWKSLVYVTLYIRFPNLATRRAALAGEHWYSISARAEKAWKRGCRRTLSHAFSAGFPACPETKNPRCRHLGFPSSAKTKSIPSKTRPEPSEHSCITTATWKQSPWQDMPDTERYFPLSIFPFCDLLFFQRFLSHG